MLKYRSAAELCIVRRLKYLNVNVEGVRKANYHNDISVLYTDNTQNVPPSLEETSRLQSAKTEKYQNPDRQPRTLTLNLK